MRKKLECNIVWLRRDLRLEDNTALHWALQDELPVLVLFIFDPVILTKLESKEDSRVEFIHHTLSELKQELKTYKSDLLVLHEKPIEAWNKILKNYDIRKVFYNEDYEPYARERDETVERVLSNKNIEFFSYKDQCIFAKEDILKSDGKPYTVYTPYKRRWYEKLTPEAIASLKNKKYFDHFLQISKLNFPDLAELGFKPTGLFPKARTIKKTIIEDYHEKRNIPSLDATSKLGLHLRFGTISVRKCAQLGYELNQTWLDELIWREFFMQILYHFPHVVDTPFKEKYKKIKWMNDKKQFKKFCEGKTGYALVDAGMRELNQTGFMHNRVRMVAASFLIKHLLIDWRWGEKYFAQKLLDFDLASNNGNWQWVAGTGCDAAPYFRVFNPDLQIKRFDPEFKYIKKWVPEFGTKQYPEKMIEHRFAVQRAIMAYQEDLS